MIGLERAGPICGSLSSSAAVAVLRLVLATRGAVAAPVVAGFAGAGAVTAGPGFAGCTGCVPCAKAGMDSSASIAEVTRTRRVNIAIGPLRDPSVSVRKHFESFESFVIQSGDLIREGHHRCGRRRTADVTTAANCDIRVT